MVRVGSLLQQMRLEWESIIDDTVSKCEFLFSVDDIIEKVPVLSVQHAFKVYDCLCRVFTDLQEQITDE